MRPGVGGAVVKQARGCGRDLAGENAKRALRTASDHRRELHFACPPETVPSPEEHLDGEALVGVEAHVVGELASSVGLRGGPEHERRLAFARSGTMTMVPATRSPRRWKRRVTDMETRPASDRRPAV